MIYIIHDQGSMHKVLEMYHGPRMKTVNHDHAYACCLTKTFQHRKPVQLLKVLSKHSVYTISSYRLNLYTWGSFARDVIDKVTKKVSE